MPLGHTQHTCRHYNYIHVQCHVVSIAYQGSLKAALYGEGIVCVCVCVCVCVLLLLLLLLRASIISYYHKQLMDKTH